MGHILLILANVGLLAGGVYLLRKKGLLSYLEGGQWWLTWLAIGIITLMDELTSIFYAPSEAYRFLGLSALTFIPLTAILIRYLTTRMVEIAEILDVHGLKGGGVYNFSYLVLGPIVSFVAVSSIMVDYVLTASISTVSAIENATSFMGLTPAMKLGIELVCVWVVAGLNILGIRENAKVTFTIFIVTAIVLFNFLMLGFGQLGSEHLDIMKASVTSAAGGFFGSGFFGGYFILIAGISNCILAYSGVESVMQTASFVKNWRVVQKAYLFLALSVGIVIPLMSVLVLSHPGMLFAEHETDLITHYSTLLGGKFFGLTVAILASIILLMAMNTAYVASSELMERVAHRYNFNWIIKTNKRASLYRIHIVNGMFFSLIILITQGAQHRLAEMYAVGLVASFVINLICLIIYRYSKGTKEVAPYHASRTGTMILFLIILSCFAYLCYHKPWGFVLWISSTIIALLIGVYGTKKRAPEWKQIERGENPMDLVLYIADSDLQNVNVYFKRPLDTAQEVLYDLPVFITFYSPRQEIPARMGPNHFRIPFKRNNVFQNILGVLELLKYELPDKNITIHFGWPTSSWADRLSTGVMVFKFMKLPQRYPEFNFKIENFCLKPAPAVPV